jgi:hypothetical protein
MSEAGCAESRIFAAWGASQASPELGPCRALLPRALLRDVQSPSLGLTQRDRMSG